MTLLRGALFVLLGAVAGASAVWFVWPVPAPDPTAPARAVAVADRDGAAAPADAAAGTPPGPVAVPGAPDSAEGELRALRSAALAFPVAGVVAERLVEVGDEVAAGDPLLRLDDVEERTRLREAEAALAVAAVQVEVARAAEASARDGVAVREAAVAEALAARDAADAASRLTATQAEAVVTQAEAQLRQAQAAVTRAEAGVAQARADLAGAGARVGEAEAQRARVEAAHATAALAVERRTLRAPFDGRVVALGVEVGEPVAAGSGGAAAGPHAVTLADLSGWRVETTNLTELQVVGLAVGDTATVEIDALPGRTFPGTVEAIGYAARQVRGDVTYVVTIVLEPSALADARATLRPGMTAVVRELRR